MNFPMPSKRSLRPLTVEEKLEAIRRVQQGESKASVARNMGVPESTLRGWCKSEDKIAALAHGLAPSTTKRKSTPEPKRPRVESGPSPTVLDQTLSLWLMAQQQASKSGQDNNWLLNLYNQYGLDERKEPEKDEPLALVKNSSDSVLHNINNNNELKENEQGNDDEKQNSALEAVHHGERLLEWLESCSDPKITTFQLVQFRYLLNNVRSCADRQVNGTDIPKKVKSRRK